MLELISTKELVTGLIVFICGAVLGSLGKSTKNFIFNKIEEHKFPMAGNFLTEFEDEKDGKKEIVKAPLVLKQFGLRVKGRTELSNRVWILEGKRTINGYLIGNYYPENKLDKGVGNFFLEFEMNGDMSGYWTGHDSVNKKITSGKYNFYRIHDFTIRGLNRNDVPSIIALADKELGRDYLKECTLLDEQNIAICAEIKGKIIGFCTGRIISANEALKNFGNIGKAKIPEIEHVKDIGLIGSIAINKDYGKRGIGTALIKECLICLNSKGARFAMMTAWKSKDGIHIGSIAEKNGFTKRFEIENFWKEESLKDNYSCPECNLPPCHCTAAIYTRFE